MNTLSIVLIVVALAAMLGTVGVLLMHRRQDKQRGLAEDAVAKAAQDYFARFQIRARTIGAVLPDNSMVLMVETPPQKKMRFSYIIEPPVKRFIREQTGVEVVRIFWRFPISPKQISAPEVKYADAATTQLDFESTQPYADDPTPPPALPMEREGEMDEYFQHQSYHIEEVSWEDFSTVTHDPADVSTVDTKSARTKK